MSRHDRNRKVRGHLLSCGHVENRLEPHEASVYFPTLLGREIHCTLCNVLCVVTAIGDPI